jgi:hypothetical protein
MPHTRKSFLFFPRKEQGENAEPGPSTRHIRVNRKALEGLFHLKLKDAAREIGLCSTTFKKACRRFQIDRWPSRGGQRDAADARRNAQTDAIDGTAIIACRETSGLCFSSSSSPAPSNATVEAVSVSSSFPSTAASSPTVRAASKHPRDYPDPFGAVFSSASCIAIGVPVADFQPTRHPNAHDGLRTWDEETPGIWAGSLEECYGEQGDASDPPDAVYLGRENVPARNQSQELLPRWLVPAVETREQSCLEAVLAYLDGPLAGNFDFMFQDEEAGCEFVH